MSLSLQHQSVMHRVRKAIGACAAKGTIRIVGTGVLNIIVEFMISNRDVVAENEMGKNNSESSFWVYNRRRANREDIFSIYSDCVMMEDLGCKVKHLEIAKNILEAGRDFRGKLTC